MTHPPPPAREGSSPGTSPLYRVERSAGGVVVRIRERIPYILLIRDPYRRWGLPKGHLEEEERPMDAAIREVREETGLALIVLGPDLGEIDWTFRLRGRRIHKYCRFFLMTSPDGETVPEAAEGITACRWLPIEDAARTIGYDNARGVILRAAERIRIPSDPSAVPWTPEGTG